MKNKKIFLFFSLMSIATDLFSNVCCYQSDECSRIADEIDSETVIINYGYANYKPSPYSKKLNVITFDSQLGILLFEQSLFKKAFFLLAPHYAPQLHINSCAIASAVMILNTIYSMNLREPPLSICGSIMDAENKSNGERKILYGNFVWTEANFFNEKINHILQKDIVKGIKKKGNVYEPGVAMDDLAASLMAQGVKADAYHIESIDDKSKEAFRNLIKKITKDPTDFMIVNYNLNVLSDIEGGHFSLVGAYNEKEDKILILDVWSAFGPWFWIDLNDLYHSMHTKDKNSYRGYVLVNTKM